MDQDQNGSNDEHETNDAAPISDVFLKRRRWTYAWKGAGVGTFVGILILGSMILYSVKSPNPDANEGMLYLLPVVGAPVIFILGLVLKLFMVASHVMGISSQWVKMAMSPLIMFLSIPLNWGMIGFLIGGLVGKSRNFSLVEANQRRCNDGRDTNDAVPIFDTCRKRRRVLARRGAAIGVCLGLLTLGSMILFAVESSDPPQAWKMSFCLMFLGVPVNVVLGIVFGIVSLVVKHFTLVSNGMPIPGRLAMMGFSPFLCLAMLSNWGTLGLLIGWWAGSSRHSSQSQAL